MKQDIKESKLPRIQLSHLKVSL